MSQSEKARSRLHAIDEQADVVFRQSPMDEARTHCLDVLGGGIDALANVVRPALALLHGAQRDGQLVEDFAMFGMFG